MLAGVHHVAGRRDPGGGDEAALRVGVSLAAELRPLLAEEEPGGQAVGRARLDQEDHRGGGVSLML